MEPRCGLPQDVTSPGAAPPPVARGARGPYALGPGPLTLPMEPLPLTSVLMTLCSWAVVSCVATQEISCAVAKPTVL